MRVPGFLRVSTVLVTALCLGTAVTVTSASDHANVVVIVSDDQGYADISCYPHADDVSTPNLDRIADDGVRLTNGYASCPVCAPTRAGLLTGRYQQRFGFYTAADSRAGLPRSETTLADILQQSGYATGVFGKWHLGYAPQFRPLRRGFDTFYGFLGHGGHDYFDLSLADDVRSIYRDAKPISDEGYLTRNITREAVAFIKANRERPFFAYVPYNAVHNPLQAPDNYIRRYPSQDPKRSTYLAMLAILDEGVGDILDVLDELDLSERTLVIFLSDNGGARGTSAVNGALRDYKHSVYEGGVRVPFLLRWPGRIEAGSVSHEPVISIDVFSTVLSAAGIEPPRAVDSRDILSALDSGVEGPLHEALFWNWMDKDSDVGWAVRKGRWKLVANKGEPELYDLQADLSESRDLATAEPDRVQELLATYQQWQADLKPRIRRSQR